MASHLFEPFQFENPRDWFMRMEAAHELMEASSGKTISQKTYLLSSIGSKASTLLADLLAPTSIQDSSVDYKAIKNTLLAHLKAQHLEIAERSNFYAAVQGSNESAPNFYGRLKKLAEFCNFGSSLESMLRDRMVLGCRSIEARKKLLQLDPLTLKMVQDSLAVHEAVDIARTGALAATTGEVHFSRKTTKPKATFRAKQKSCYRCGKQSCKSGSDCPAMGKQCGNCSKMNHFRSVCKSKSQQTSLNSVDSLLHVDVVPTHSTGSRMTLKINGHDCLMEIDTGAVQTMISSRMWRKLGSPTLSVSNQFFSAYDDHRMKPIGALPASRIESGGTTVLTTVTVINSSKPYGLLGRDVMDNFVTKPVVINSVATVETVLPPMKIQPVSINIADPDKLRFCKARPVPLPLIDKVNAELQRLQDRKIIKPVASSKYASPVVWVQKRDGTLRMCVDFKVHVNCAIESDAYPIPAMETIFSGMSNAKCFAKLDLKDAYWQIPLDSKSMELCTINTSKGLFQMKRLPKGMKNSSAIFQRVIEVILKDISGLIVYQDDILLHAPSSDSLAKRLSTVLRRLEEKGVTVNLSKSILNQSEIKFLGHVVSATGIRPDPDITKKILSFKPPTCRAELESFLGLVNFFGRMIPHFSQIVQPLHGLRKKDIEFVWTDSHQASFDKLLKILAAPPVLKSYELSQPVTLTTDASENAIAGILTQNGSPVMFVSRVLTSAEKKYSNVQREALAVVWSVLRLKQLLLGRHFYLITDHKPLVKIYGEAPLPKVASNRLIRWAILLQRFNFTIEYKPGSEISHADALTRLQLLSDSSDEEDLVINNVSPDISDDWKLTLQQASASDQLTQSILKRVQSNDWSNLQPNENIFYRLRSELTVEDGVLYKLGKCVVPLRVRKDVFNDTHMLHHTGVKSSINRIKLSSWWPSMSTDVRLWIQNCPTCTKLRPSTAKQLNPWPKDKVFERLHADWFHASNIGDILIVVDSASGWIECSYPQARTTSNVIATLSSIFCRFGVPRTLVTDNAPEFTSRELNEFCHHNGITKMESPPYHAQSNGSAERGVQTIKNGLKAWRMEVTHLTFTQYMQRLLLHHRACFQRADGYTPGELVYGRKLRVPLSRNFLFSDAVAYKSRNGALRDGTFLLDRGSNTSWVLDSENGKLRLTHHDQLSRQPLTSTPMPKASSQAPSQVETSPLPSLIPPLSPQSKSPIPTSNDQDPDATLPMVASPSPSAARPQRNRKKKVISDYNDL